MMVPVQSKRSKMESDLVGETIKYSKMESDLVGELNFDPTFEPAFELTFEPTFENNSRLLQLLKTIWRLCRPLGQPLSAI